VTLPPLDPVRRDAGALDVPDLPTAILGWRTWRVGRRAQRRTELVAPLAGITWPARQPMVATCGSQRHTPPGDGCACGLYAVTDPGTLEWGPSDHEVLGVVALWGQVLEGARGWRASHAYPRFVVTGPAIPGEQRAALARRYGVPVHRSEVPRARSPPSWAPTPMLCATASTTRWTPCSPCACRTGPTGGRRGGGRPRRLPPDGRGG
jgi:hypothetical protein